MTHSAWKFVYWVCAFVAVAMALRFFWQLIKLNLIIVLLGATCVYLSYKLLLRK